MPVLHFYHRLDKKSVIEVSDSNVFAGVHKTRIRLIRAEILRQSDFDQSAIFPLTIVRSEFEALREAIFRLAKNKAACRSQDLPRSYFTNSGSVQADFLEER